MSKKLTIIYFINESNKIHNNFYDYSLVDYKNIKTKVKIICPKHGVFEQTPVSHLNGHGCIHCSNTEKHNTEYFINESNKIHNNFYDYSLVDYKNNRTKVKIICPIHDIFEQRPLSHINNKQGCPSCKGKIKLTFNSFIKKSKEVHGNKYNYSLVEYKNIKTKVKIICPKHGVFEQIPDNHIRKKYGCPFCNESKGENKIKDILNSKKIKYTTQKAFKDCKYKQLLKFDFYLFDYNCCIEYDGEQHFFKYRFEKDTEKLKIRQKRDNIKTEYCINNNIKLIRINYNDNIQKIINKLNFLI